MSERKREMNIEKYRKRGRKREEEKAKKLKK